MKFIPLLALLFILPLATFGQHKQISGSIVHSKTQEPVPFAHLYNVTLKTGSHANGEGSFGIAANVNDSIRISAVGFVTQFYVVQQKDLDQVQQLALAEETMELAPVNIFAYKDIESLKKAIIESDAKPEQKQSIFGMSAVGTDYGKLAVLPRIEAPKASHPAQVFGPKIVSAPIPVPKDKEQLLYERKTKAASKYNALWVQEVTGLDEEQVDEFMRFCLLEEDFIVESSEYELTAAVLTCLDEFKENRH